MKKTFFITGTDTDVGKTQIAAGLLAAARQKGLSTVAVKPVAAGCEQTAEGLRNGDALLLQQQSTLQLPYQQVNPVALEPAIAPHIAAQQKGQRLQADRVAGFCRGVLMQGADFTVIEGAGGWRVPLNQRETFADIPRQLQTPVILVVAMKLGCINHALLTAEAIRRDGLQLAGWVANRTQASMDCFEENLQTLQQQLPAPLLGTVPFLDSPTPENIGQYLDIEPLL
ncbi:dethiobiotin synthase [bacterium SCSIO 12696]|nr:dethiobiotin synthase [bacterium SCSIO 12696]